MRGSLSAGVLAALVAKRLVARDFLWIIARHRDTGADVPIGFWSDLGPKTAQVVDPDSGSTQEREFYGAGEFIKVSSVPLTANLSVQTVTISMSQIADSVNSFIRTYDCKQGRVQLFRGLFSPTTRVLVAPAPCRFVGFIDGININTPEENEDGEIVIRCMSHTQEMMRSNSDTRSDASQKLRSATDNFYQDAGVVGEWELFWGGESGNG